MEFITFFIILLVGSETQMENACQNVYWTGVVNMSDVTLTAICSESWDEAGFKY